MFFSQVHEDVYVQPLLDKLERSAYSNFADAREAVGDNNYPWFHDQIADEVEEIKDRSPGVSVINVRRKTALRLWELYGGNSSNRDFRAAIEAQTRASKSGDTNSSTPGNSATTSLESTNVNNSKATQTISYIFGRDVSQMSTTDLINAATRVKADIKTLQDTGLVSTKVEALIAEHQASLAVIIAALDAS